MKTPSARNKIRAYFSKVTRADDLLSGRDKLAREMRKHGLGISNTRSERALRTVADHMGYKDADDMLVSIGTSKESVQSVANRLLAELGRKGDHQPDPLNLGTAAMTTGKLPPMLTLVNKPKKHETKSSNGVVVEGVEGALVRLSRCCNPVPGDDIIGFVTRGRNIPGPVNIVSAIILIVIMVAIGYNLPLMGIAISLDYDTWMIILGAYILVASVAPVWILLQPRDYLSSYLLYGMIILAIIGIVGASVMGAATDLQIPAFTGFVASNAAFDASTGQQLVDEAGKTITNKAAATGFLFPALFITIACGAISGFHSLVASGTTSKQLDKEGQAQPIGYGGMLIECVLAVISLCAVGFVWSKYAAGGYASPTAVFADGLSQMLACIPGLADAQGLAYALLILAVSAFCLTSLDTATRLARYMFQELWTPVDKKPEELTGVHKFMANPYVATIITVVIGIVLGMTGYSIIWPLFGAANQLLAALALLAVCAWLGNAGRNNKMFFVPMAFMLLATLTSLAITFYQKVTTIMTSGIALAPVLQAILAVLLFVLAIVLAVKGVKTIVATAKKQKASSAE